MKDRNRNNALNSNVVLALLAGAILMSAITKTATAKSLYVIADIKGSSEDPQQPVQAYDIGVDGTLTFQAQLNVPHRVLGAVGMAIDADSGFVFVTYEAGNVIQLLEATTLRDAGTIGAPDALDLAGIVYNHKTKRLYCVDRTSSRLYRYDWDPVAKLLTHAEGSPHTLRNAHAFGIALDEIDDLLYVGNNNKEVTVYSTSDWRLVNTITLSRVAISIALDVKNGFVYTGAGFAGNKYLTQYDLVTGKEAEVQVEPDAGVMGLGVDPDTGLVYMSTGKNNEPGGDNLLVYDSTLNQIQLIAAIGNPTGLAIPGKDIGYNPLNLRKSLIRGAVQDTPPGGIDAVAAGRNITYGIYFDNLSNNSLVTGVSIVDTLPDEVEYVPTGDDKTGGQYDSKTHTYTWSYSQYPPGSTTNLELTVRVKRGIEFGSIITNSVTINSNETPPTTTSLDTVVAESGLNLTKTILDAPKGKLAAVDVNEVITYIICFDNDKENGFTATDVVIDDYLPDEVSFLSADGGGKAEGKYDPKTRTYSWSHVDMPPGDASCLGLVVQVNPTVKAGTIFTNSAVIDSNETSPSMASVDAIVSYSPLNLSKSIDGTPAGARAQVIQGTETKYRVSFDNSRNSEAVTNVVVSDTLPKEVEFVKAEAKDDTGIGGYDPATRTYTRTYASVGPKDKRSIDLTVRVNKDVAAGTIITNTVTVDSDQTEEQTASVEAITPSDALKLTKQAIEDRPDEVVEEIEYVDIGDTFTYKIRFVNESENDLHNVSVVDALPEQVVFLEAITDNSSLTGQYIADSNTYEGSVASLAPGAATYVKLRVRVKEGIAAGTIIINAVTVTSDETLPAAASVTVTAANPLLVGNMSVRPNVLRLTGTANDLLATVQLPTGIEKDNVGLNRGMRMIFRDAEGFDRVVAAKRQLVSGTISPAKIMAAFDRTQVRDLLPGYGQVDLIIKGRYLDGKNRLMSYRGLVTVTVTRFAGD